MRAADVSPSPDKLERITEFFNNEVTTGKLPGAVILIQQHGRPVYLKCFGVRDVATAAPMTPDTIFALHSMTKPITSLAAMMLIDAGELSLVDPVSKYIPSFADVKVGVDLVAADGAHSLQLVPPVRSITIMDLLRHTSGITYGYIGGTLIEEAMKESSKSSLTTSNEVPTSHSPVLDATGHRERREREAAICTSRPRNCPWLARRANHRR